MQCNMDIEHFMESVVGWYKDLMVNSFSVKTLTEFQSRHCQFRDQILIQLPLKWQNSFGINPMPTLIPASVAIQIDQHYNHFSRIFVKMTTTQHQNLLLNKKLVLEHYNEEMNRFIEFFPQVGKNDIERHHDVLLPKVFSELKKEFESIYHKLTRSKERYIEIAQMTRRTLENPVIGIDLGISSFCVMIFNKGEPMIVPNMEQGNHSTTPIYVSYREDDSVTFGYVAKGGAFRYPNSTIYNITHLIGREWNDPQFQEDRKNWAYETVKEDNYFKVKIFNRKMYPEEILAQLFGQCKKMTEEYLGVKSGTVRNAVITVPAYFTELQRKATVDAGSLAGLEVRSILGKPIAASIAYTWKLNINSPRKFLIYDLGKTAFDVAIVEGGQNYVKILRVDRDGHLGGQDFDKVLMEYCLQQFEKETGINIMTDINSSNMLERKKTFYKMKRVISKCKEVKRNLSEVRSAVIELDSFQNKRDLTVPVTREQFNELVKPLVEKTIQIVHRVIKDAKIFGLVGSCDIEAIILVGGSTRMPIVTDELFNYFGRNDFFRSIDPEQVAAYGAALQAAFMNKN